MPHAPKDPFTEPAPNNFTPFMIHIHYSLSPDAGDYNFSTDTNNPQEEEIVKSTHPFSFFLSVLQYICRSHDGVVQIPHVHGVEEGVIAGCFNEAGVAKTCIQNLDDLVQRLEPVAQLSHLSPQH